MSNLSILSSRSSRCFHATNTIYFAMQQGCIFIHTRVYGSTWVLYRLFFLWHMASYSTSVFIHYKSGWVLILPRVYNKRREYRMLNIVHVICVRRVTWLPALRTWLSQIAKYSPFLRTATNRGGFREFYARFFMNARFVLRSARVFSRYCTRVSLHSRPMSMHVTHQQNIQKFPQINWMLMWLLVRIKQNGGIVSPSFG